MSVVPVSGLCSFDAKADCCPSAECFCAAKHAGTFNGSNQAAAPVRAGPAGGKIALFLQGGTGCINRIIEADKFFLRSFLFFCTCACKRKETNQRKENQRKSKELVRSLFKNFRSQEPVNFFQIPTSSNRGYDRGIPPVPPDKKTLFFT